MNRILLLEDDHSFGYILSEYLGMQGFQVHWLQNGASAQSALENQPFDLAILDVMVPNPNGFELAAWMQSQGEAVPFIFLSARSLKVDQLKGYQLGAYDYVTKPVDEELLVAKIRALLARVSPSTPHASGYELGQYTFWPQEFRLVGPAMEHRLTAREVDLLLLLCRHHNILLPRKKALQQIWGNTDEFSRKSMDVFISHLRKYLADDTTVRIDNIHGKGFILRGGGGPILE
ncbi:MAG: response regulator transcription factor [Bacteroidota bacterium]